MCEPLLNVKRQANQSHLSFIARCPLAFIVCSQRNLGLWELWNEVKIILLFAIGASVSASLETC